jgi:hypothetical protein
VKAIANRPSFRDKEAQASGEEIFEPFWVDRRYQKT